MDYLILTRLTSGGLPEDLILSEDLYYFEEELIAKGMDATNITECESYKNAFRVVSELEYKSALFFLHWLAIKYKIKMQVVVRDYITNQQLHIGVIDDGG